MELSNIKIHPYAYPGMDIKKVPKKKAAEIAIEKASHYYAVPVNEILGKCRKREVVAARIVVAAYLWEQYKEDITYRELSAYLGRVLKNGRGDHAVAMHYVRQYENLKYLAFYSGGYAYLNNDKVGKQTTLKRVLCESLCTKQATYKHIHIGGIYTVFDETEEKYWVRNNANMYTWYKKAIFREI